MNHFPLSRAAGKTAGQPFRYRPHLDLLEDRLPPGSIMGPLDQALNALMQPAAVLAAEPTGTSTLTAVHYTAPELTPAQAPEGAANGTSTTTAHASAAAATSPVPEWSPITVDAAGATGLAGTPPATPQVTWVTGGGIKPVEDTTTEAGASPTRQGGPAAAAANDLSLLLAAAAKGANKTPVNPGAGTGINLSQGGTGGVHTAGGQGTRGLEFPNSHELAQLRSPTRAGAIHPAAFGNPPPGPGQGGNPDVNVSNEGGAFDHENISIAVNPRVAGNAVAVAMADDGSIEEFNTTDGGATWTFQNLFQNPLRGFPFQDPDVAFDSLGRCFMVFGADGMDLSQTPDFIPDTSIVLAFRSTDGGVNFTFTIIAFDSSLTGNELPFFFGQPATNPAFSNQRFAIATGPAPGNPSQQNVYITWTRSRDPQNTADGSGIAIVGSVTGGLTYSAAPTFPTDPGWVVVQAVDNEPAIFFTPPQIFDMSDVAVGPTGQIYSAFWNLGQLGFNYSLTFNGRQFQFIQSQRTAVVNLRTQSRLTPVAPQPFGVPVQPSIDVDRSPGSPNRGRIYLAYNDVGRNSNVSDLDIFVTSSTNGGRFWVQPKRVNDDVNDTATQYNPRLALDQATGGLAIAWEDARLSQPVAANDLTDVFASASVDGGYSFAPNVRISDASSSSQGSTFDFGFNLGIAAFGGRVYYGWADNSLNSFPPAGPKELFADVVQWDFSTIIPGGTGEVGGADRFEANNSSTVATNLGVLNLPRSLSVQGLSIFGRGDVDWYKFSLARTGTLQIDLTVGSGDLDMRLYKLSGSTLVQVGSSTRRGNGVSEQITLPVTSTATQFYLYVFGYNQSTGDYRITFSER